jgi:peptidyl-prolyl cis-trans isomerase C
MLSSSSSFFFFVSLLLQVLSSFFAAADDLEALRLQAKPWYLRNLSFSGHEIPISPVTIFLALLTIFYAVYIWTSAQSYAVASHILLTDASPETQQRLAAWKEKIGNDAALFAQYAAEHSACPSKANGGSLGRFRPLDMAPPFDRVCFDPKSPLKTTLGPVQTQFGWHLIYLHERKLAQ